LSFVNIGKEFLPLPTAICRFNDGKLSENEVVELFQQIIDLRLKGEVSASMANAADVYLRHGLFNSKKK